MKTPASQRLGQYLTTTYAGESVHAFLPPPLPPDPPLKLDGMLRLLTEANQSLGRLDGLGTVLPDLSQFIYAYIRKEAVLSSQIEGTQSSLSDLLSFEQEDIPGVALPGDDLQETSNYVTALTYGLERLSELPLSKRLIREIHAKLLASGRGNQKDPGEFRRSQNWIGGTRPGNALFVPPPPEKVEECMSQLQQFLHDQRPDMPVLVKAALMHVQFETIHPFLDGNGRLGRLLITFLLCAEGALKQPLLYLSLYLKTHRDTYYELLMKVRKTGAWEEWVEFFLTGVRDTADQAVQTAKRVLELFAKDDQQIHSLKRAANSAFQVHQQAKRSPVISIRRTVAQTGLSFPAVSAAVEHLQKLGILREATGRQRGRLFVYTAYLDILSEGTEPLPR